ncbi:translocation/assembly module TamB domain-containing protein [Comamonas guangdongensis]|uniref:Translocation/assembly module TamB domain-containing protein n=1 Tax=Comamonas guangdongensis TaxID=510515 RepID=A0ABV3ZUU4_9BURK
MANTDTQSAAPVVDTAAAPSSSGNHQRPARGSRWRRACAWLIAALAASLALLLTGLWWWSGREGSLGQTLQQVARWLPQGQSLQTREVTGTLRSGGRIGWLQWQNQTTRVEVRDAQIAWQLSSLLSRSLRFGQVQAAEVRIASTPEPEKKPSEPLQSLAPPIRIDLPFAVERIVWQGPPEAVVEGLKGHYGYDGSAHRLQVGSLRFADGAYQAQLQLQGAAPMQLKAEVLGDLQVANPLHAQDGEPAATIAVQAKATVEGTLATEAARLEIRASAQAQSEPQSAETPSQNSAEPRQEKRKQLSKSDKNEAPNDGSLHAEVQASLMPWKPQPLLSAQARLANLDLSAFWPQGPQTLLTGRLQAGPDENPEQPAAPQSWKLDASFGNGLPGPWDKQRLPLSQLQARVHYDGQQWQVAESRVEIGKGRISLDGRFTPATQLFEGRSLIERLNPADLYSTLEAAPLQGEISAKAEPAADADAADQRAPRIVFAADLRAAGSQRGGQALHIQTLSGNGRWQAPLLQLDRLQLQALQADIQAQGLEFNTETRQAKAQLKAAVPGAQLQLAGQMGPKDGKGQSTLQLSSLETLAQWLRRLPGIADPLGGAQLEGSARAQLDWQGGWGALVQRFQAPAGTVAASGLQLNAAVQAEKIRYRGEGQPADQTLAVPALQLSLNGSPENARLTLLAQAQQADRSLRLDTALQAGLAQGKTVAAMDWQASIEKLQAQLAPGKDKPGPWLLQLQPGAPLQITQRSAAAQSVAYQLGAARLQITPPNLGIRRSNAEPLAPAQLTWDGITATRAGNGQWGLRSSGRAQGIPLAWVDAFSLGDDEPPLAAAGVSGDLSFNGQWDVDTMGKDLKAELVVERAAGDLRLAVDDGGSTTVIQTTGPTATTKGRTRTRTISGAGMRTRIKQARLTVQAQGSSLTSKLVWDSERAGTAQADLRTQLAYGKGGWTLPANAPLSGQLQAAMPDIGIWTLFAPPGWRVKGTLAANATLAGTLQDPRWQGSLNADELSIVSLLDGVDLQDGMLRARLQGTRLDIAELRLKGGKGSRARILGYSGNLSSAPEDGGLLIGSGYAQFTPPGSGPEPGLSMNLQAKASKLQVLVRADRQVSVSGDLQARLERGQFTLRGNLTVDRASIILPEESAPSLGSDVVVHSAASRQAEEEARKKQEQQDRREQARATPRKLPDILVKLNLGRDFALQGYGLNTRLLGQLEVQGGSHFGGPPRVTGEIRTEHGRYRAWGQSLDVDTGLIRFNGPYDNPSLDILALRPNIPVKAGVQVLGTASAPRVLLYSDPSLPDAEKLSWVVMGRDPASGGASSALLQQAAMALLAGGNSGSGKIASSLGLDEVGFKGAGDSSDASGAALTMGKRLSDKLYLTYEQSLSGAMGIIYIFYDLSRNVTLRTQTGMTSALDLVYTVRKD